MSYPRVSLTVQSSTLTLEGRSTPHSQNKADIQGRFRREVNDVGSYEVVEPRPQVGHAVIDSTARRQSDLISNSGPMAARVGELASDHETFLYFHDDPAIENMAGGGTRNAYRGGNKASR